MTGPGSAKVEEKVEECLSTNGMQERRIGTAIVLEGTGAGIGMGAGEGLVGWLNSMAIVKMKRKDNGVLVGRRRCWGEDQRVKFFIVIEGRLCMFQIPLRYPRVFFGGVTFPLDQEHAGCWSAMVA